MRVDGALDELLMEAGTSDGLELVDRIYQLVSRDQRHFHLPGAPASLPRPCHGPVVETRLPAVIKPRGRFGRALIHAISSQGIQASCSIAPRTGELVLIKIGRWGTDQFSFPCRVCRVLGAGSGYHLTLEFNGPPLKVSCPRSSC